MIDLIIVLVFVAYAITAGLRARLKASRNLQEYFLAGRSVSGWRAGLSMAATQFAADTPLLVTGLVATGGVFLLWRLWIYGLAFLLMAFVFAVGWRRAGVLTDAELTEIRYSGTGVLTLRVLKAIYYGTIFNCAVMAMVLVAAIRIAEVFLPWHQWLPAGVFDPVVSLGQWLGLTLGGVTALSPEVATANNLISIVVMMGFTALYSLTGGLRAVISTDVVQFAIAIIGTIAYAWVVLAEVGGIGGMQTRLAELYGASAPQMLSFTPPGTEVLWPFVTIVALQWFFQMNADGTGYLAQRSMACATDRDARIAGIVFAWTQVLLRSLIWLVIGVGLLVLYPFTPEQAQADGFAASRELLFVTGINDLLPVGLRGLMLTGLLAALASTIDTHLNWGASYWSNDLYKRFLCGHVLKREPGSRELVVIARLSNVVLLVIALLIMVNLGSIQEAWITSLLLGAGMGSVLVLRWLWERINLYSELAAIVVSLVLAVLILFVWRISDEQDWLRLALMASVSTVAAIGITFFTPRTDPATLVRFYQRVRPMGWWQRTAELAGEAPSAPLVDLARRLRAMALCALSLFLLLVGIGRLLVPTAGETTWLSLSMVIGAIAVVPLWWRDAFVVRDLSGARTPTVEQG